MNITGEYTIQYNIFTMFNVYNVKIKNHNLITSKGYEFFMEKWYTQENYHPIQLGYLYDGKFYLTVNAYDEPTNEVASEKNMIYVDKKDNKQYVYDGEKFVDFYEKLEKICIGKCNVLGSDGLVNVKPSMEDTELYYTIEDGEYEVDKFDKKVNMLVLTCEISSDKLNGTTEIGVKTNHGRLVSHDIHKPYNLPFNTNIMLEYVFKLNDE